MPKIRIKEKVPGNKGVVVSYCESPNVYYFRERIPGTKQYRNKVIEGAETIEEAMEMWVDTYDQIKGQTQKIAAEIALKKTEFKVEASGRLQSRESPIVVTHRSRKHKVREILPCVDEWLEDEQARVDAGILMPKSLTNKRECMKRFCRYIKHKGLIKTNHIKQDSFQDYVFWRKAAKSTRNLEMLYFKDFLKAFCMKHGLIDPDLDLRTIMPKLPLKAADINANPPLIEPGNWNAVMKGLRDLIRLHQHWRNVSGENSHPNHRGAYFNKLFYRWCMVMKNSGLRPDSELNKLRWCDVKRENVGRWSESEQKQKDKWIATIYVRQSKTGKQRMIPTNGVDTQLNAWRKEQQAYIDEYCPHVEITEDTLIFGNPFNEMRQYAYNMFSTKWLILMENLKGKLKPYVFSDRNYTPYSLRSTYICNLILQGKDIYTVAKLAGHTVQVCEKYYAQLDMAKKAKTVTDFEYGRKGRREPEFASYLSDDPEENDVMDGLEPEKYGYKMEVYAKNQNKPLWQKQKAKPTFTGRSANKRARKKQDA